MDWQLPRGRVPQELIEEVANLILQVANREADHGLPIPHYKRPSKDKPSKEKVSQHKDIRYRQPSVNIIERLYNPLGRQKKQELAQLQRLYKEVQELKDFKVSNLTSKRMNEKNPSKPIFQRTAQILQSREGRLLSQHRQMREEEELFSPNAKSPRKVSAAEFNEKQVALQRKRNDYLNHRRLQQLNLTYAQMKDKPELTNVTQEIIKNSRYDNTHVLDRFEDHSIRKRYRDTMRMKRLTEQETPFIPSISRKSRIIANRSFSNLGESVFDRISRQPSRDCIKNSCSEYQIPPQRYKVVSRSKSKKEMSTAKASMGNVTFSTPMREPMKSLSKSALSKTNTNVLNRSKINLNHVQSCNYLKQEEEFPLSEENSENKELKKILFGHKDEVIQFVKRLIIKERILTDI